MSDSNQRLRQARIDAKFGSARSAALKYGWPVSTYASHENGQTPVPVEAAREYARRFKVSASWILTGEGESQRHTVPVVGYVGAGAEIVPFDDAGSIDEIEVPPGTSADTTAAIVRGNSMYPRYFDGEYLFYSEATHAPSHLIGQECVVRLADGRMLVKILRRGSRPDLFHLESWNAPIIEDQVVDWAAAVKGRR